MHIGMRLLHPAAADHSVSINRQQVQRIFRFLLRSRAGARPLSGGTAVVQVQNVAKSAGPSGDGVSILRGAQLMTARRLSG